MQTALIVAVVVVGLAATVAAGLAFRWRRRALEAQARAALLAYQLECCRMANAALGRAYAFQVAAASVQRKTAAMGAN